MPIKILQDKVVNAAKKMKKVVSQKKTQKMRKMKKVKKSLPKKTSKPGELYNSQRAKYEKAMNAAQKKGGSNGVGVGY